MLIENHSITLSFSSEFLQKKVDRLNWFSEERRVKGIFLWTRKYFKWIHTEMVFCYIETYYIKVSSNYQITFVRKPISFLWLNCIKIGIRKVKTYDKKAWKLNKFADISSFKGCCLKQQSGKLIYTPWVSLLSGFKIWPRKTQQFGCIRHGFALTLNELGWF